MLQYFDADVSLIGRDPEIQSMQVCMLGPTCPPFYPHTHRKLETLILHDTLLRALTLPGSLTATDTLSLSNSTHAQFGVYNPAPATHRKHVIMPLSFHAVDL